MKGVAIPSKRLFSEGSLFICEGPAMAKHLGENGCPPDRIRIVRLGLDLSRWPFAPPARASPLITVQVSRFVEKKGIDLSLRAFAAAAVAGIAERLLALAAMVEDERLTHARRGRALVDEHHDAASLAGEIESVYHEALDL